MRHPSLVHADGRLANAATRAQTRLPSEGTE